MIAYKYRFQILRCLTDINNMKQSLSKTSDQQSSQKERDFKAHRTNRLKKYRDIRKLKACGLSENNSEDGKTVTKEEKVEIKKLRNREAAQRARDKAKLYTIELEKELEVLKNEIVLLRNREFVCVKCSRSLGMGSEGNHTEVVDSVDEYFFEEQKIEELEPMFEVERVKNNHSFSFPMFLMMVTIVLCLFVPIKEGLEAVGAFERRPHRLLQQIVNVSQYDQFTNMRTKVYPHKQNYIGEIGDTKNNEKQEYSPQDPPKRESGPEDITEFKAKTIPNDLEDKKKLFNSSSKGLDGSSKGYDVLFCDESRIYRYGNRSSTLLDQEVRIIINRSRLEEVESKEISDEMMADSYETTARISKVNGHYTKF